MEPETNPLLSPFETLYQTVPFDQIKPEHFEPAYKSLIKDAANDFKKLISNKENPTFQNTFLPIEKSYDEITRLGFILFNLNSAETNPQIQAVTPVFRIKFPLNLYSTSNQYFNYFYFVNMGVPLSFKPCLYEKRRTGVAA
jgi:Zn-dependent oligopeptidase